MKINRKNIILNIKKDLQALIEALNYIEVKESNQYILMPKEYRDEKKISGKIAKVNHPIVYTIELIADDKVKAKLLKRFESFCESNKCKTKNVDRVNHSRYNEITSDFLYVGSSMKGFETRLKSHLGLSKSIRTYSLHLSRWDEGLNYEIKVQTYSIISKLENPMKRNLVEIIEQQFWDKLKPVFGKRSGLL